MINVILIFHLLVAVAMVGTVLLQKSEGGALGIGGGNMGGLMTTRGTSNLLTKSTGILATIFMVTSLLLAILAGAHKQPTSILDAPGTVEQTQPADPAEPAVPLAK